MNYIDYFKEDIINDKCISYAMGVNKSIYSLQDKGFIIKEDDGDYCVTFDYTKRKIWEDYIKNNIKDTYWNEYIRISDKTIYFMIKENNKIKYVINKNYERNDSLLDTCNRLCEGHFTSIKELIFSNDFYKKELRGFVNENYIFSEKNFELNIDQWKPGNPLWITGSSGDGKSTYAQKLATEHSAYLAPLDLFLLRICRSKENFYNKSNSTNKTLIGNGSDMIMDYINQHPELPWYEENNFETYSHPVLIKAWTDFFEWALDNAKNNPKYRNRLIIFEGCNICFMPPELACRLPLIIMGTSNLQGSLRRIKRDTYDHPDYSLVKNIFREIKRSQGYIKGLNDSKNNFKKSLKKELRHMNESLETSLTRPFIGNNVTLYHVSRDKLTVINPAKSKIINAGTKLSNPRLSTWWVRDPYYAICVFDCLLYDLFKYGLKATTNIDEVSFKNQLNSFWSPDYDRKVLYVNQDYKHLLLTSYNRIPSNKKRYLYTVTVPKKIVGRGHNIELDEYTLDVPIKPDKCEEITMDHLLPYIEWKDGTYISLRNVRVDVRQTYKPTIMDKLIYHDNDKMREIRKQYKNLLNEACKDVNTARKFIRDVNKIAKKYNANYFIVTDGASKTCNTGNPAVQHARDCHKKWELEHGEDPYETWSMDTLNEIYDRPMSLSQIKKNYGPELYNRLKEDEVHRWRAQTGIELIHKEPSKLEFERIWLNWNQMPDRLKRISDKKSLELFGMTNEQHYKKLILEY